MKKVIRSFALVAGLLMIGGSIVAHHGNSAYDEKNPITIKGTVTEFVFSNPHCQVYLDVKDDKGNVVHWSIESMSPAILVRDGWTKTSLKTGDQIAISLIPARNGSPVGFSGGGNGKVVVSDGRVLGFTGKSQQ